MFHKIEIVASPHVGLYVWWCKFDPKFCTIPEMFLCQFSWQLTKIGHHDFGDKISTILSPLNNGYCFGCHWMVKITFGCYLTSGSYFWLPLNNDDDFNPHQNKGNHVWSPLGNDLHITIIIFYMNILVIVSNTYLLAFWK